MSYSRCCVAITMSHRVAAFATVTSTTRGHMRYSPASIPNSVGWEAIHSRVDHLASFTILHCATARFQVITPESARGGIVSIQRRGLGVVRALAEAAIFVEDRGGVIRVSPHFYNTEEDIERFVSALARR